MAEINANHVNPFLIATTNIFRDVCRINDLKVGRPYLKEAQFSNNEWVIIIGLTGELKGQVLISLEENAVLDVASRMMGMPDLKQMDDITCSAVCELGNMVLGNAATLLAAKDIGIDITPPTLSHGNVEFTNNFTKNLCVPFAYDNGAKKLEIHLSIKG